MNSNELAASAPPWGPGSILRRPIRVSGRRWAFTTAVVAPLLAIGGLWSFSARAAPPNDPGHPPAISTVRLPVSVLGGLRVSELSGLAWDNDEQMLYGISDRGHLLRFRLRLDSGRLTAVEPLDAVRLHAPVQSLPGSAGLDAEGLAILKGDNGVVGDAELLVSTEGQPQVWRVSTGGEVLGRLKLPDRLSDARRYQADNAMLEAVAHSPLHGLLAAAEAPLADQAADFHEVHAEARSWRFPALDGGRSRLKAMEVLPDGSLVVLERARVGKGKGLINALRRFGLASCGAEVICAPQTLLLIDPATGAENFEGMAQLGEDRFLLVSDNMGDKQTPSIFLLVDLKAALRK